MTQHLSYHDELHIPIISFQCRAVVRSFLRSALCDCGMVGVGGSAVRCTLGAVIRQLRRSGARVISTAGSVQTARQTRSFLPSGPPLEVSSPFAHGLTRPRARASGCSRAVFPPLALDAMAVRRPVETPSVCQCAPRVRRQRLMCPTVCPLRVRSILWTASPGSWRATTASRMPLPWRRSSV